jgi:4-amino-4-deoxy-L-arabinose transferase-like glycosyltransferase
MIRTSTKNPERKNWWATTLLLAVIVVRLGFAGLVFAHPDLALANDTDRYRPLAELILAGQAYGWNTHHTGELENTVGYPLFLAGVYRFFGRAPWQTAASQLIFSGLLALIVYLYLARTVGVKPGLISALILAVDPLGILWSLTVLTETLFAVVLGIAAVLIAQWAVSQNRVTLLAAGAFLGMACLVKPFAELIVVVWTIALIFFPSVREAEGPSAIVRGVRRALLFLLPVALLIAPWVARNAFLWNCPTLSSVDRITLRDYVAAKIVSEYRQTPLLQVQDQLQAQDGGVCPSRSGEYLGIVLAHPLIFAKLQVAGTIPVLIATNFDRWFQLVGINFSLPDLWRPFMDNGPAGALSVLRTAFVSYPPALLLMFALTAFQLLLYALVILGLLTFRHLESAVLRWNIVILTAALLVLLLTPGQGGNERFRVPAQPLFVLLAGYGLGWTVMPWLDRRRARGTGGFTAG